ncbi:MAG: gamma-glutamyl-gamma-aminobutyrate hydrolase family protein [bacterium]|nr:gamma-glutamyl-gamma-aminobutyrate hydrolase family protein [bacterium]
MTQKSANKLVGIIAGLESDLNVPLGEKHFVRTSYINKLINVGLTPLLISPYTNQTEIESLLSTLSGFLLTGGGDIDPKFYNEEAHPLTLAGPAILDQFSLEITRQIVRNKKPLLAICRGQQVLNVALGGSLHQHIPDVFPNETHRVNDSETYVEALTPLPHEIIIEKKSILESCSQSERIRVNSSHHQAINKLGRDLVVSAQSPLGVIEGVEHRDHEYFCLATQFHLEMMEGDFSLNIFKYFSEALKGN